MPVLVDSGALASLTADCFRRLGLGAEDAHAVAEALVDANLRGNDAHGVARLPAYLRRVDAGAAGGTERVVETARSGPLRRLDAGAALGPAVAAKAVDLALELAGEHGIGLVAAGNSSHFGAAGYYARHAAERGMLALVATNGPAGMAPHGSTQPFLGTNAFAVAAPLSAGESFVLDMSSSVAARGKIIRARELGEPIDPGLAIGASGQPTTDAAEALAGAVLPLAGAKGSGLALAISLAVGILAGASFDDEAGRMHDPGGRPQDLGHVFLVVDPWRLADRDQAERRVAELIERLHSLTPAPGFERVLHAGERGERERRARLATGVPVAAAELAAIARVCDDLGHGDLGGRARSLATGAPDRRGT